MAKLSVVVVTKNEERNICQCLESVQWADEIVVVDAFSSDRTVEICREFTDEVYQREWANYADQKNYAISLALHQWVLLVDADEKVTAELALEIRRKINSTSGFVAYHVPHLEYMFGKWLRHGGWYPQYHIRLFMKDQATYVRPVHEQLIIDGEVGYLQNPILHFSHIKISDFLQKLDRYTSAESRLLFESGKRLSGFSMIFYPIGVFLYKFFWQQGFRDGWHGLVIATLYAFYHFTLRAKLGELWYSTTPAYIPPPGELAIDQ